MFDQLQQRQTEGPVTFAEPGEGSSFAGKLAQSAIALSAPFNPAAARMVIADIRKNRDVYTDLFVSAERQQRTVDNVFASTRAQEEVYDRWISRVREETGIALENPLRGGYRSDAMRAIRDEVHAGGMASIDGVGGVPERQLQIFNQRLAEAREAHPDKAEALTFGDVREEARGVAREAETGAKAADKAADRAGANPVVSLGFEFAGGLWAGRRDPIFVGSLFAGPTSAVGKTALTRIATSGLFQGFFNAGVSAMEQPAVQAWRAEAGIRSGVMPAIENVGMAFLFGLIPGAAIRGIHEQFPRSARAPAERIMSGRPEPGDADAVVKALGDVDPAIAAAVRAGEEVIGSDRALMPRPARNVTPELHDDMNAAALKHADDPVNSPSPEAVEAIRSRETATARAEERGETLPPDEIQTRIAESQPHTQREAEMIASEVIEEQGTRAETARMRQEIDTPALPKPEDRTPRANYVRDIAEGNILPTTQQLKDVRQSAIDADRLHFLSLGGTDAEYKRLGRLNREIDQGSDEAIREKQAILDRLRSDIEPDIADPDTLRQLALEFSSLERQGNESLATYADGVARVLKRYLADAIDGDEFAQAVFRKAFAEAKANGIDTKALGKDAVGRFLKELSESDREFMEREFLRAMKPSGDAEPKPRRPARDPLEKIPFVRDDGTPTLLTRGQVAKVAERDNEFAMLVKSCQ